jgi:hypothetical protein
MMYPLHYWRNGAIMHEQASNTLAALCTGRQREKGRKSSVSNEEKEECMRQREERGNQKPKEQR